MLRRTNSYSYTANEQDKQAAIPPPAVLQNRLSTTSSSSGSNFTRSTEERRSYNSSTLNKTRHRGYKGVLISQATPATVKFSIYNPEVAWIFDMSRPRSPSKGSVSSLDNEVAELDQVLAVVKEQLNALKFERKNIGNRIDNLTAGIKETGLNIKKIQQVQLAAAQRSPSQALRRIRSLDGRAQSYTQLPSSDSVGMSREFSEESGTSTENSPLIPRRDSLPSKAIHSFSTENSPVILRRDLLPSKAFPSFPSTSSSSSSLMRNTSLSKKGSPKGLETIHDTSIDLQDDSSSTNSTPQSSPTLRESRYPYARVLVNPYFSKGQGWSRTSGMYNTLPSMKSSSSSSSSSSYQQSVQEDGLSNCSDSIWEESFEGSTILRVSSATGQIEQVCRRPPLKKLQTGSTECIHSPNHKRQLSLQETKRLSVSTYFIGSDETDDSMIMKLTEEPLPPSRDFPLSKLNRHSCIVRLGGTETTV